MAEPPGREAAKFGNLLRVYFKTCLVLASPTKPGVAIQLDYRVTPLARGSSQ